MNEDETINGAQIAAAILNRMAPEKKARLMERIQEANPAIAGKIEANLVSINDIPSLTSQSVQALLREIDRRDLVLSLKTATPQVQGAILQQMPERAQNILREELAALPDSSEQEARAAQARLISKMEEMRAQGRIREEAKNERWA